MKIGKIISVEFDKFKVKLFHTTKNSTVSINGVVYYFGNIGSYLKVQNATSDYIICEVVAVLDNSVEGKIYSSYNLDSARELVIKPVGTLKSNNEFEMGVGIFPSIYSDVWIVTNDDLEKILNPLKSLVIPDEPDPNQWKVHSKITIGYSKSMINYKIDLNINKLFNIHTAVLGNSGSGKSNTIAHIFQEVFRKKNFYGIGAKVILFDVNGEYKNAFETKIDKENVEVKFYKPNAFGEDYEKFVLPYYLMNLDEWTAFLMASDRTQKPFWDKVLQECYRFYKIFQSKDIESKKEFSNYLKWKLRNILQSIVTHVDSDTSKMTSAKGAISHIQTTYHELCKIDPNNKMQELSNFLSICNDLCIISFGYNSDTLAKALPDFTKKTESPLYISISGVKDNRGSLIGYSTNQNNNLIPKSFEQIDEDLAIETDSKKLGTGQYFDYKFLKTAVSIALLEEEAKGNSRIREFTSTMLSRLDYFLNNNDCDFMKESDSTSIASELDYLDKIFGIKEKSLLKQLIIIDSSEVGSDILELMTSVVSRMIFDYRKAKYGDSRRESPIHLVLDEAHRYIKKNTEYILKENIFEKIAREGRKYSYYLMVSSQRPSELSETVLSQCGNFIVHRIQNEVDMKYIYSVLPYFSPDYINKIKQSVPGEALIFGNCVPMPLHIKVIKANPDPNSENCKIDKEWYKKGKEEISLG